MNDSAKVTITLTPESAEKLRELAGDLTTSQYLTTIIERLHSEQLGLSASEAILKEREQAAKFQQELKILRERLHKLTLNQEELMATVKHLKNLSSDLSGTAQRHHLQ
jgi:hypothetical protein